MLLCQIYGDLIAVFPTDKQSENQADNLGGFLVRKSCWRKAALCEGNCPQRRKNGAEDGYLCGKGQDRVAILKEQKVDIVLSDVMMPGIDGIKLCEQIGRAHV